MRVSRTATAGLSAALMASVLGGAAMAQSPAASMAAPAGSMGAPAVATPGQDVKMLLLPKFLGILPFDAGESGRAGGRYRAEEPDGVRLHGTRRGRPAGQPDRLRDQRARPRATRSS